MVHFPSLENGLISCINVLDFLYSLTNILTNILVYSYTLMDNMLDYQSRDCKIGPLLLWSFGRDFKPKSHLRTGLSRPFLGMGPRPLELGKIASF